MIVSITENEGRIECRAPYNTEFVRFARGLRGKWQKPVWSFDLRDRERVEAFCREKFGTAGERVPLATVRIRIGADGAWPYHPALLVDYTTMELCGIERLRKISRDRRPVLGEGTVVVAGVLPATGGSMKNPKLVMASGMELEIRDVPRAMLGELPTEPQPEDDGSAIWLLEQSTCQDEPVEVVASYEMTEVAKEAIERCWCILTDLHPRELEHVLHALESRAAQFEANDVVASELAFERQAATSIDACEALGIAASEGLASSINRVMGGGFNSLYGHDFTPGGICRHCSVPVGTERFHERCPGVDHG